MDREELAAIFNGWADGWQAMGSPLMGRLGRALPRVLDDSTETGRRVLGWQGDFRGDAVPIRLTGGLNALRRRGASTALASLYPPNPLPDAETFEAVLGAELPDLDAAMQPWLDAAPQTNEVGRSAVIFPALMLIASRTNLPLRLFELGASAGLNMQPERFAYDLGGVEAGDPDSPVRLSPEWSGPQPLLHSVEVAERRGVDIGPLDPTDPQVAERLLAYCWPDQAERVERLSAALALAAKNPPTVDGADAAEWTERRVEPRMGQATVVFHTIAFQYFPEESKRRIADHLHRRGNSASEKSPLFWLRFEDEYAGNDIAPTLRLKSWPGGTDEHLADAHPHGSRIGWHGAA